jgi:hypothetical protein
VVLSIDEKSQIQALDRTQPGLPIKPGRCQTMTHDYKPHGTTTLFAALSVLASQTGIWGNMVKNILRDPDQMADTLAYTR